MMEEEIKQKRMPQKDEEVTLIRILGKDIRGDRELLPGLTNIQGISWSFANAICANSLPSPKIPKLPLPESTSLLPCAPDSLTSVINR